MRDTSQLRSYRGMKLASWLIEGSYWEDTLTPNQVMFLINRVLNSPEIYGRWNLTQVDVTFADRGTTAWAMRLPQAGRGTIHLPPGTRSALLVLHELAHLLNPTKREPHHGPGFTAIHLMLVDLFLSPQKARVLAAAYHATGTPSDPSRIPQSQYVSKYVPIVGADLQETIAHVGALIASGVLKPEDAAAAKRMLTSLKKKAAKEPSQPLKALPDKITIPTRALLRANTNAEIAALVLNELRADLLPGRMIAPKVDKKAQARKKKQDEQRKKVAASQRQNV